MFDFIFLDGRLPANSSQRSGIYRSTLYRQTPNTPIANLQEPQLAPHRILHRAKLHNFGMIRNRREIYTDKPGVSTMPRGLPLFFGTKNRYPFYYVRTTVFV